MTLAEMKAQKQTPMMMAAIDTAIKNHGAEAEAAYTKGTISTRKGSNAQKTAKINGFDNFSIYAGPRAGKRWTEGYRLIVVKI